MKNCYEIKKVIFNTMITITLIMSIGITAYASSSTASGSFTYEGYRYNGYLYTTWNSTVKDTGYAKTTDSSNAGDYILGAYINAYDKSGYLKKSSSKTGYYSVTTSKISYNASKFTCVHNIKDSSNATLKSCKTYATE